MAETAPAHAPPREGPSPLTADDLLRLPTGAGQRYELLRGELKTMSPSGSRHGRLVARLGALIEVHVRSARLGVAFGAETGFVLEAANHARWKETVLQLAKDAPLARRLGIHGRQWLEAHVGSAIWNRQFDAVIQTVLAR